MCRAADNNDIGDFLEYNPKKYKTKQTKTKNNKNSVGFSRKTKIIRPCCIYFTFYYVDGVPSLNNSKVGDYVNPIYSMELEINDTTCTVIPVSYQKLPKMVGWERTYAEKNYGSLFPLWTFHLYIVTFKQHLHMEYIFVSWYDIPELVVPVMISLIDEYY